MPAVAATVLGAPGATGFTWNNWLTRGAARNVAFPAWSALIEQLPALTNARRPPDVIVQMLVVDDVYVGARPDDAVAVSVGVVPKFCAPGLGNVIVWSVFGITAFDAPRAAPVPAEFVAVTVNV